MFVRDKLFINEFNCCFWPKYHSISHNNASSSENAHPLLSHQNPYWFWTVFTCKLCFSSVNCAPYLSPDLAKTSFSKEESNIMDRGYFSQKQWFEAFCSRSVSLQRALIDVDYCDNFICCLNSSSDGLLADTFKYLSFLGKLKY